MKPTTASQNNSTIATPHHIIAIGASAGGMEEINNFFDHTPLDGVSYVIIQHLSPDFKSRMVELLAKHSKLTVKEAADDMTVESNLVYLIPHDKFMTIQGTRLHLTDKQKVKGPHLTINTFFNSLAKDCGKKAIGVVLSGLGSDGTEGIKAIKKSGGMVIARNPETTQFGSMPSNAIATGMVDFVLEPALMPNTIEDYVKHELEVLLDNSNDHENLTAIVALIKEKSPLDFTDYKQTTILRRIKRRAAYNNFTRLESYLEFLKKTPDEVEALVKDFLISVTAFFRDKGAFDFIKSEVLPGLLKRLTPGEELKLWVAGCATGEEAYSLAMLLCEQLNGNFKDTVIKIFATDIDAAALVQARSGIYKNDITKEVSAEMLEKHFLIEGDNYRVKPEIRKMVIFAQHDLVKNPPYCNMHFISCRNLLIYMTPALQKKIFAMLLFGLKMDGYLFLGSSENPMPIMHNLQEVNKQWKIYKNLEAKRVVSFDAFSVPELTDRNKSLLPARQDTSDPLSNTLAEAVSASLVNEMSCLAVCIDENNRVVKSYGDTTKYLIQKNFTLNLAELLPGPLALAFNTLSASAYKTNQKVSANGITIKHGPGLMKVSLSISPLVVKKGEQKLLIVTISEDKFATAQHEEVVFDEKIYIDQYTMNLEEEVHELKDKLRSTTESLDASNENMQSFNEELLSANEEMQSTNEEMQSINEELHTINSEYQLKNKELLELNDDLNNYFRSNLNGQLFVNRDLLLMKFSPGTVKHINLQDSDIGRPLTNISTNIKFETIADDIKEVIAHGGVITKEVEANNGKSYQVMTMPYIRQADNQNDGAIITFNDISELKKAQWQLHTTNKNLLRINADLDNFVLSASHDLLGPLSNIEVTINLLNRVQTSTPEFEEYLKIINVSVKKFRSLIKELSIIGKIENDIFNMEAVDVEKLIDEIKFSISDKIESTKAVITTDLQVARIKFSKKNLRSILLNLISNSIKYKSDQRTPHIHITTTIDEENFVQLSVGDDGIGISKKDLTKIFNVYNQLQHDIEGQGIGLYLVKKVVETAGGKIMVESEPGKGSTFKIFFKVEQVMPESVLLN